MVTSPTTHKATKGDNAEVTLNVLLRILTFLISFIPLRTWPQDPPKQPYEMAIDMPFLELEEIDHTQAQIDEIKKQITELQKRFERIEKNPLRRVASSPNLNRDYLAHSTKD